MTMGERDGNRREVATAGLAGGVAGVLLGGAAVLVLGAALASRPSEPPAPPAADIWSDIHYGPDENLEAIDARLIDGAARTIDMAAYVLTDRTIIESLARAARRGVKIRIWRDAEMAASLSAPSIEAEPNVEIRAKPMGELMHLKGYCIDGEILRTGSANFSRDGETRQDNDLVILRGACSRFEAKFARDWGAK